jgi:hypothetical protein
MSIVPHLSMIDMRPKVGRPPVEDAAKTKAAPEGAASPPFKTFVRPVGRTI